MKKLLYIISFTFLLSGVAYASFPVKSADQVEKHQTVEALEATSAEMSELNEVGVADDSVISSDLGDVEAGADDMLILLLLWFFLGGFAAHRWYANKPVGANILFIITLGGCGVWAIIDLIKILQEDFMN